MPPCQLSSQKAVRSPSPTTATEMAQYNGMRAARCCQWCPGVA
jgi:hypothetical protein